MHHKKIGKLTSGELTVRSYFAGRRSTGRARLQVAYRKKLKVIRHRQGTKGPKTKTNKYVKGSSGEGRTLTPE